MDSNEFLIKFTRTLLSCSSSAFISIKGFTLDKVNLISFSVFLNDISGQIFAMLTLTVAAAEAAIGLAILVVFYRNLGSIEVSKINKLKG